MYESDRLSYLKALGITNYMPRWSLPGAPESRANPWLLPQHEQQENAPSESTKELLQNAQIQTGQDFNPSPEQIREQNPIQTGEPSSLKSANELLQSLPTPDAAQNPIPAGPKPTSQPITSSETKAPKSTPTPPTAPKKDTKITFALSFWRVSEDWLIADSRHSELALPTEKLLSNILFALGLPRELPKADVVQWPMIDAPHQDQGEDAARESLHAFLDGQLLLNPGKYLLVMGEDACQYLLGMDYQTHLGKSHAIEEFDLTSITVPSLTQMLQKPELKQVTWNALKHLRQQ